MNTDLAKKFIDGERLKKGTPYPFEGMFYENVILAFAKYLDEREEKIEVVPSPRLDWCGECKKEHGYHCPKEDKPCEHEWKAVTVSFDPDCPIEYRCVHCGKTRFGNQPKPEPVNPIMKRHSKEYTVYIEDFLDELTLKVNELVKIVNTLTK